MNLEIKNLSMSYESGKKALSGINLELNSPNLIGLVGPNGAGKSTLMKLLVARLRQTSGEILINGGALCENEKFIKSRLGYLPQDFGLYDELTVRQFLSYMAALKKLGSKSKECVKSVVIQTNLTDRQNARIRTLSGGQRQRVGIAQALLGSPELLIFDEPTVGLDPEERINFRNLFSQKAKDKIVILSTHIIEDVQSVCNRLIAIDKGSILFDGSPGRLIQTARGHVGIYTSNVNDDNKIKYKVTSRVFTTEGIQYRIIADRLPDYVDMVEPSLEDAYMFLISQSEELQNG